MKSKSKVFTIVSWAVILIGLLAIGCSRDFERNSDAPNPIIQYDPPTDNGSISLNAPVQSSGESKSPAPVQAEVILEPKLEDYAPLPGDTSYDDRIEELIREANQGRLSSLLLLGRADIKKRELVLRLNKELRWPASEREQRYTVRVLAKLGDEGAKTDIMSMFHSGVYFDEEDAVGALAYMGDEWAIQVLSIGLSKTGSDRQVFKDGEVKNASAMKDRPFRFSCLSALGDLVDHEGIDTEKETASEDDIIKMSTLVNKKRAKKL